MIKPLSVPCSKMDQVSIMKILANSPKGNLRYDTGWDERPNAITTLITEVQEVEVDQPKRTIIENAFRVDKEKERNSLSPKPSIHYVKTVKGRYSLPGRIDTVEAHTAPEQWLANKEMWSDLVKKGASNKKPSSRRIIKETKYSSPLTNVIPPKLEFHIEDVSRKNEWNSCDSETMVLRQMVDGTYISSPKRQSSFLTPPGANIRRKKIGDGSPHFKPSPYASSTHTQTHSSTTSASEATSLTPTRKSCSEGCNAKSLGIRDEPLDEEKLDEDIILESNASPFTYIIECLAKHEEEVGKKAQDAYEKRMQEFQECNKENERKVADEEEKNKAALQKVEQVLKKLWAEQEHDDLQGFRTQVETRLKKEEKLHNERKAALDALEKCRQAERQEQLRIQKVREEDLKKKEDEAIQLRKQQQLHQENEAEAKRKIAEEEAAKQKVVEATTAAKSQDTVPGLDGLILKEDLQRFASSTDLLRKFEEPTSHIDGKNPTSKAFYIGAVKCINTPLNALADTSESEILAKIIHLSKLLTGEQVSGGGSMATLFSSKSIPHGDLFVMKTLAFRFVKKSEADVTRGQSTVQPLATVGTRLCKLFPIWASLVQAYLHKLCPFLVPFSYPQGEKSIQEYAKELGHDLSGTETAIQQTFLERIKGYCTLYALMVLKFNDEPFDIGSVTDFFTLGGAWQIVAKTLKLEPQVDVTATVIHTLLQILDDRLYATYKAQFIKLIRLLVTLYLPKIKAITPPTKSGSLSRLQIYVEKKYAITVT